MATKRRWAIASDRVVLPDAVSPAAVLIEGSRIERVVPPGEVPVDFALEDLGGWVIAPGVVDTHVHINEPGRTEWEGFETATRAAAAGGVTTLVDMPLNSDPVTTNVDALQIKREAARGKCCVDVGFYGGLVAGGAAEVESLLTAGVLGIKAFLCHSGLDEFPAAGPDDLQAAAPLLARAGRPLLVHGELTRVPAPQPRRATSYVDYLASRPSQWESDAIALLLEVCRAYDCPIHLVHLANGDALTMLEPAKRAGLPITVETCPHYLFFSSDDILDGHTQFKCAPPIREHRHRELLWSGLSRGVIDTIGSDHSPCPPAMKQLDNGDFMRAWGGIASLQLLLSIVWTGAAERAISLWQIFQWLSSRPARLVGLENRKGRLAAGCDADITVFDPDARWNARDAELHHRHKLTPYDGATLRGRVKRTYLRGQKLFDKGEFGDVRQGALLSAAEL